jgi:hypothetical protein
MPPATLEIGEELTALLEQLGQPVEQAAREMIVFGLLSAKSHLQW